MDGSTVGRVGWMDLQLDVGSEKLSVDRKIGGRETGKLTLLSSWWMSYY